MPLETTAIAIRCDLENSMTTKCDLKNSMITGCDLKNSKTAEGLDALLWCVAAARAVMALIAQDMRAALAVLEVEVTKQHGGREGGPRDPPVPDTDGA